MNYAHVADTDEVPEEWDMQSARQESESDINDLEHHTHNHSLEDPADDPQSDHEQLLPHTRSQTQALSSNEPVVWPCVSGLDILKAQSNPVCLVGLLYHSMAETAAVHAEAERATAHVVICRE